VADSELDELAEAKPAAAAPAAVTAPSPPATHLSRPARETEAPSANVPDTDPAADPSRGTEARCDVCCSDTLDRCMP
jgi:hypothetical protein